MHPPPDLIAECDRAIRTSRGGDTRLGLEMARHAHRRARDREEPRAILLTLNTMAICGSGNGAHIQALSTAIDAIRMGRALGDRGGAAHAMLTLAAAAYDLFESPDRESMRLLSRGLEEAVAIGDVSLEVRARNVLGIHLGRTHRFAEGLDQLERALALVPASDGTTPASLLIGNIAHLAVRAGDRDAERRLDDALARAVAEADLQSEMRAHFNRGWWLHRRGDHAVALESYQSALDIANNFRNRSRIADISIGMGDALSALGRHEAAATAFDAAYAVADEIRPARQIHEAAERLREACTRAGDERGATRAGENAARERALYERERKHARVELERILKEI